MIEMKPYDVLQIWHADEDGAKSRWLDFSTLRTPEEFRLAESVVRNRRWVDREGEFRVVRGARQEVIMSHPEECSICRRYHGMERIHACE